MNRIIHHINNLFQLKSSSHKQSKNFNNHMRSKMTFKAQILFNSIIIEFALE